jgi:hypothetical protein
MLTPAYMASYPDASKPLDLLQHEIGKLFTIQIGQRNDDYLSFKVGVSEWFSIRITGERKNLGSPDWIDGEFNWNGRWKVELLMGVFGDRCKTWRPADEKFADIVPKVAKIIQEWVDADQRSNVVEP